MYEWKQTQIKSFPIDALPVGSTTNSTVTTLDIYNKRIPLREIFIELDAFKEIIT